MFFYVVGTHTKCSIKDFAPAPRIDICIIQCHTVTNGTDLRKSPQGKNLRAKHMGNEEEGKREGKTTNLIECHISKVFSRYHHSLTHITSSASCDAKNERYPVEKCRA